MGQDYATTLIFFLLATQKNLCTLHTLSAQEKVIEVIRQGDEKDNEKVMKEALRNGKQEDREVNYLLLGMKLKAPVSLF